MKVLKKRAVAIVIDSFVIGFLLAGAMELFKSWSPSTDNFFTTIIALSLMLLQLLRDLLFRNASLGKMIMGLRIYDDNWEKPSVFAIIKRSAITSFAGLAIMYKAIFMTGNYLTLFDCEANYAHTRVIDKKVFKKLKKEIADIPGDFAKKMTEAYNSYLRDCYSKG